MVNVVRDIFLSRKAIVVTTVQRLPTIRVSFSVRVIRFYVRMWNYLFHIVYSLMVLNF